MGVCMGVGVGGSSRIATYGWCRSCAGCTSHGGFWQALNAVPVLGDVHDGHTGDLQGQLKAGSNKDESPTVCRTYPLQAHCQS